MGPKISLLKLIISAIGERRSLSLFYLVFGSTCNLDSRYEALNTCKPFAICYEYLQKNTLTYNNKCFKIEKGGFKFDVECFCDYYLNT